MPYQGELASKVAHVDVVRSPDVQRFLSSCTHLRPPSKTEGEQLASRYLPPPPYADAPLPDRVVAMDGSFHESSVDDALPSTKVGYVKVSSILIDLQEFASLRVRGGRLVDPFRVAALERQNRPLAFTLPSANVTWSGKATVRDSFRVAVDAQLLDIPTRFDPNDHTTSLRSTLFHLASRRPDHGMGTNDPRRLKIHRCPDCEKGPNEVRDITTPQKCPHCGAEVYPSDCLRLWEEVTDFQSNAEAISRFMTIVEHLLTFHYVRFVAERSPTALGGVAFFVDGPLALFGNASWLHASIMRYLGEVNERLEQLHQPRLLVIGLQKTGQVVDHAQLMTRFVPPDRLFPLDDDYRYRYVVPNREPAERGFGDQTYFGQDFIFRAPSGRTFVFALPYPHTSKREPGFHQTKADTSQYPELPRALTLLDRFQSDLYANAVVPIALAHRYTAISLEPGGRVLDLLTRRTLGSAH